MKLYRLDPHHGGRRPSKVGIFLGRLILISCVVLLFLAPIH